jgi:hypothetical protein
VDPVFLVLRLLHVGGGILWAGGAVLTTRYITPAALALGPAGAPFMAELTGVRKMTNYMTTVAATTVLAGSAMFLLDANSMAGGDIAKFVTSGGIGTGLAIGGLFAWIAFFEGMLVTGPTVKRMGALGAQAAAAGGPPPAELMAQVAATQAKLRQSATMTFWIILVAIVCMATARYWPSF